MFDDVWKMGELLFLPKLELEIQYYPQKCSYLPQFSRYISKTGIINFLKSVMIILILYFHFRLIFLDIPMYGCARNTNRLTGYWTYLIKQLEAGTKHIVIPVHARMWQKLSEQEQIRYISQAIRLKCDELSAIVN